jgi:hypothetical protein
MIHQRQTYNLLQLMGDVGGVLGILVSSFEYLMDPIVTFWFNLYILKHLYKVKTEDQHLVMTQKKNIY